MPTRMTLAQLEWTDDPHGQIVAVLEKPYEIKLRRALAQGKVEVVEGSYCQPYFQLFSGESTIRQPQFGKKVTVIRARTSQQHRAAQIATQIERLAAEEGYGQRKDIS